MRFAFSIVFFLIFCSFINGQNIETEWYSEYSYGGIIIQNSYPKGGPYPGPTIKNFNYSYLVFFSRIANETDKTLELNINFSADSIAIPNSPDTFVKLFLPRDTMTLDKRSSFSYGIMEIESFDQATEYHNELGPGEECLFYVVAIFYQTNPGAFNQKRGGNRAELILKGQKLFYSMLPQVDVLPCGQIKLNK